eukprot:gene14797-17488_t
MSTFAAGKIVTVLGKGGVGKTLSAVALAKHYSTLGQNVLLAVQAHDLSAEYFLDSALPSTPEPGGAMCGLLQVLRMFGAPARLQWYMEKLQDALSGTDMGRLMTPTLVSVMTTMLEKEAASVDGKSASGGAAGSWSRVTSMLQKAADSFTNPKLFTAFLVTSSESAAGASAAQRLWAEAMISGIHVVAEELYDFSGGMLKDVSADELPMIPGLESFITLGALRKLSTQYDVVVFDGASNVEGGVITCHSSTSLDGGTKEPGEALLSGIPAFQLPAFSGDLAALATEFFPRQHGAEERLLNHRIGLSLGAERSSNLRCAIWGSPCPQRGLPADLDSQTAADTIRMPVTIDMKEGQ